MEPGLITFTCTDRLNETKSLKQKVDAAGVNNGEELSEVKRYNRALIDQLKLFQVQVNDQMTEFVNNEKKAVEDKVLSNEHLILLAKKIKSGDDDEESSESEDEENEDSACLKRPEPEDETEEQVEKRLCV
jgi:hypothetical protein